MSAAAVPVSFAAWQALINNSAIERAAFGGVEIGILQSLREVPGFLAFAVDFLQLVMREQTIAFVSLPALGIGTAVTGMLPTVLVLYFTTVLMSVGFHYGKPSCSRCRCSRSAPHACRRCRDGSSRWFRSPGLRCLPRSNCWSHGSNSNTSGSTRCSVAAP